MDIILQGAPRYKSKHNLLHKVLVAVFFILPIVLLIAAAIMLVLEMDKSFNIFLSLLRPIGSTFDLIDHRLGWFFKGNATFATVFHAYPLEYTYRFILMAGVLLLGNLIIGQQCPYCGHFFTLGRISEDRYTGTTSRRVSNTYNDTSDAWSIDSDGDMRFTTFFTKRRQNGTEETDHYAYNVQCSCCGCVAKKTKAKTHTNWD